MKKHRIPSVLLATAMVASLSAPLSATLSLPTLAAEPTPITDPQTSLGEGSYSLNVNGTYVPRAGNTVSVDVTWGGDELHLHRAVEWRLESCRP